MQTKGGLRLPLALLTSRFPLTCQISFIGQAFWAWRTGWREDPRGKAYLIRVENEGLANQMRVRMHPIGAKYDGRKGKHSPGYIVWWEDDQGEMAKVLNSIPALNTDQLLKRTCSWLVTLDEKNNVLEIV